MRNYNKIIQKNIKKQKNNKRIINLDLLEEIECTRFNNLFKHDLHSKFIFKSAKFDLNDVDLYNTNFDSEIGFNTCDTCGHCSGTECNLYKRRVF